MKLFHVFSYASSSTPPVSGSLTGWAEFWTGIALRIASLFYNSPLSTSPLQCTVIIITIAIISTIVINITIVINLTIVINITIVIKIIQFSNLWHFHIDHPPPFLWKLSSRLREKQRNESFINILMFSHWYVSIFWKKRAWIKN